MQLRSHCRSLRPRSPAAIVVHHGHRHGGVKVMKPVQAERDGIVIEAEGKVEEYRHLLKSLLKYQAEMRAIANSPKYALPFLQPGRLVRVLCNEGDTPGETSTSGRQGEHGATNGAADGSQGDAPDLDDLPINLRERSVWGMVVTFERLGSTNAEGTGEENGKKSKKSRYIVDVLINCHPDSVSSSSPKG